MFESGLPTSFLGMGDVGCCIFSQATNLQVKKLTSWKLKLEAEVKTGQVSFKIIFPCSAVH